MRRSLVVTGFVASGKRTLGPLLAQARGVPFVDLSSVLREGGGSTPDTPAAARDAQRDVATLHALRPLLTDGQPRVIAATDDALLGREARLLALENAVVLSLQASPAALLARAKDRPGHWLNTCDAVTVQGLLDARRAAYSEAHARIPTEGTTVDAICERMLGLWDGDPVAVAAGERSYAVQFATGAGAPQVRALVGDAPVVLLITDDNVDGLHACRVEAELCRTGLRVVKVVLPAGERSKVPRSIVRIWRTALEAEADRGAVVVGVGGGVVTDIAGFAAATWMRGVRWIGAPTTLLAMVDASVGGKTGVDLLSAKNAVGAFWQPGGVVCDVEVLGTEPERGYVSALAEVVKTALIGDRALFELLEKEHAAVLSRDREVVREVVERSVRVKAAVVSRDERESGLRAVLNLGHTVGHALEAQAGYTGLTHGEAVSLGLVAALYIGRSTGHTPPALVDRVVALLERLGLPRDLRAYDLGSAAKLVGHDKKRRGAALRFVVAHEVGNVATVDFDLAELRGRVTSL